MAHLFYLLVKSGKRYRCRGVGAYTLCAEHALSLTPAETKIIDGNRIEPAMRERYAREAAGGS